MTYDAAAFLEQLQALLPPGAAWSRDADADITKVLDGVSHELARVQERADELLREMHPGKAVALLGIHEAANGLPDPCAEPPETVPERQAVLLARLRDNTGHNPPDYVTIAVAYGHTNAEVYRSPFRAFRAGISRAGERLYSEAVAFWYVVAYMTNELQFVPLFGGAEWSPFGATVESTNETAPNGDATALQIAFDPGLIVNGVYSIGLDPEDYPTEVQFSFWAKSISGSRSVSVRPEIFGAAGQSQTVEVSDRWERYEFRFEHENGIFGSDILTSQAATIHLWGTCLSTVDKRFECRLENVELSIGQPTFRTTDDYQDQLVPRTLSTLRSFSSTRYYQTAPITFPASGWNVNILLVPDASITSSQQTPVSAESQSSNTGFSIFTTTSSFLVVSLVEPGLDTFFTALDSGQFTPTFGEITMITVWYDGASVHCALNGTPVSSLTAAYNGGDVSLRVGVREGGSTPLLANILGLSAGPTIPNVADLPAVYARAKAQRKIQPVRRTDHLWDFTRLYKAEESIADEAHVNRVPLTRVGQGPTVGGISPVSEVWG